MTKEVVKVEQKSAAMMQYDANILEKLVSTGDLGSLTPEQRVHYYIYRCNLVSLDPAARPFEYLRLNGKIVLYATAGCTQQLSKSRNLSNEVISKEVVNGLYVVQARVTSADTGRHTDNIGAVNIEGLKGEALANAMMKAVTKAIRRATLAHEGLGMLDETEADSVVGEGRAERIPAEVMEGEIVKPEPSEAQSEDFVVKLEEFENLASELYKPDDVKRGIAKYKSMFDNGDFAGAISALETVNGVMAKKVVDKQEAQTKEMILVIDDLWIKLVDLWNKIEPGINQKHVENRKAKILREHQEANPNFDSMIEIDRLASILERLSGLYQEQLAEYLKKEAK